MKVYGVWYMTGEGGDDLQGLYSTKALARKALDSILEDSFEELFYISKIEVDSNEILMWEVKGEVVD